MLSRLMIPCALRIWQIFFYAAFCTVPLALFGTVMPAINKLTEEKKLHKDSPVKVKKTQLPWFPVLSLLDLCLLWQQMRWFYSRCWMALVKTASYQNTWRWEMNLVVVIFSGFKPQKTSCELGSRRCFFKILCQLRWGILRGCCNGWCLSSGFVALNSLLHLL